MTVRRLGAATLLILPFIAVVLLLVGGDQVRTCLGLSGCPDLPPPPPQLLGTSNTLIVVAGLAAVWLTVLFLGAWDVWRHDRRRLLLVGAAIALLAVGAVVVIAALALLDRLPGQTAPNIVQGTVLVGLLLLAVVVAVSVTHPDRVRSN